MYTSGRKREPSFEIKYINYNTKSQTLISWLKKTCLPDPEFPEGTVSSIYYDTWDKKFLNEKINSYYLKTKVRVRWYSCLRYQSHNEKTFAEAKFKTGGTRDKIRVMTPFSGSRLAETPLENSSLITLPTLLIPEGYPYREGVFPIFQISYKRLRFLEPTTGARICIDYDICAPRTNRIMLPKANPFNIQTCVFEIKSHLPELPASLYPLTDMGCKKSAFSKYSACYQKIMRIQF